MVWCERSTPGADCPALLARLSAIPVGCCTSAILFSIFVAICFSSTPFGLHFFAVAGTVDVCHRISFPPPSPGSPSLLGVVISAFGTVSIPLGTIEAWSILDRLF
jgi:hypothetical protein